MKPPRINVIFDERRSEKLDPLVGEFIRQGIKSYEIWPCILRPNVVKAINASHKMIIEYAKENKLDEVCIAEDDLMFPNENGWDYFLSNKPKDFDVYIAGNYLINNPHEYQSPLIKVKEWVGNHLIIVHEKYYDRFLSVPDDDHIDTAQSGLGDFYVCFPYAALQRSGWSSNNHAVVNYNANLQPEWIYGQF